MRSGITQQTRAMCAAYTRVIAEDGDIAALVGELSTLYGVQRPAVWKAFRAGGVVAPYQSRADDRRGRPKGGGGTPGYTEHRRGLREAKANQPRVDRDCCPRCGARGDYGCGHSRAPLGTML